MGKLDGKVALITGSGRNIGRSTALKLAFEGANIVVNARSNQAEADAVIKATLPSNLPMIYVSYDCNRSVPVTYDYTLQG
jgi:NAD(P)-dependent dehydrogenase (short-subunit alcohol dehydrogenase family)